MAFLIPPPESPMTTAKAERAAKLERRAVEMPDYLIWAREEQVKTALYMNNSPNCLAPLIFWWGRVGLNLLRKNDR